MAIVPVKSWEIQLFEPPEDAIYTIEATSRLVNMSRRRILVYCKHHLVSPANGPADHGYCFDRDAIHTLRRIETLRTLCDKDFAGIKIILDLTAALERLRRNLRLLSRKRIRFGKKESEAWSFHETALPLIPIQVMIQTRRAIS
jgi:DNA-binding transcriptional MerR regulator